VGRYLDLAREVVQKNEVGSFSSSNSPHKDSNISYRVQGESSIVAGRDTCEKSEKSELSKEESVRNEEAQPHVVTRCIHRATVDKCAVCSGYVRWLIADEDRLRVSQANPETARRMYWQEVRLPDEEWF
jgi:hypothetical protein